MLLRVWGPLVEGGEEIVGGTKEAAFIIIILFVVVVAAVMVSGNIKFIMHMMMMFIGVAWAFKVHILRPSERSRLRVSGYVVKLAKWCIHVCLVGREREQREGKRRKHGVTSNSASGFKNFIFFVVSFFNEEKEFVANTFLSWNPATHPP